MSFFTIALLGFSLGLKHALEADHLAAVCTFVSQSGGILRAAKSGAFWGLGHSFVLVVAGTALILLGIKVPHSVALGLDLLVAIVLIGLGIWNVKAKNRSSRGHSHRRPFAVGLLHGASGTAALTLLVLTQLTSPWMAFSFLIIFGLASILGMVLAASAIAWPLLTITNYKWVKPAVVRSVAGFFSISAGLIVGWNCFS